MGVYVEGTSSDAYMVMVQGQGTFKAAASYGASQLDPKQALRNEPFDIKFVSDDRYTITDKNTGTVLGTRQFDPKVLPSEISYRGITLSFTSAPLQGDVFTVDGNRDGVGNNEGALRLVELENLRVVPGGKTLSEAYIQEVSDVGNIAQQALVAKDALTVVYDQAVEIVLKNRKASISLVQRHLKIGYNQAARMLEEMENAGVVSAMGTNGQREILVPVREE